MVITADAHGNDVGPDINRDFFDVREFRDGSSTPIQGPGTPAPKPPGERRLTKMPLSRAMLPPFGIAPTGFRATAMAAASRRELLASVGRIFSRLESRLCLTLKQEFGRKHLFILSPT